MGFRFCSLELCLNPKKQEEVTMYKLLLILLAFFGASLEAKNFSNLFEDYLNGAQISNEVRAAASENHYVLISGFFK